MTPEEPCIWRHCACWRITDRMVSHEKLSHLQHSYQQHAFLSTHAVTDHLVIWRHYTLYHRNLAAKVSVAGVWKAEDKNFQNCKKICSEATTAKFEMSVIFSRGRTFPGNHLTGAVPSNFINRESLGEDEQITHWSRCNGYKHYHKFPDIAAISGVTVNDQKVWAWLGWFCFAGTTPLPEIVSTEPSNIFPGCYDFSLTWTMKSWLTPNLQNFNTTRKCPKQRVISPKLMDVSL